MRKMKAKIRAWWHRGHILVLLRNGTRLKIRRENGNVQPSDYINTYYNQMKIAGDVVWQFNVKGTSVLIDKRDVVAVEAF